MWDDRLRELLEFRAAHGHLQVPRRWPDDRRLAHWVVNLRRQIRTGTLSPSRLRKLKELGLQWPSRQERGRLRDEAWNRRCDELAEFRRRHGHADVPCGWSADPGLGRWAAHQRHLLRTGLLREDRVRKLREGDIEWAPQPCRSRARDAEWNRMAEALEEYGRRHGDCNVPRRWPDNPPLGRWVVRQRHQLRLRMLHPDRRARLEALGLGESAGPLRSDEVRPAPAGRREASWTRMAEALARFKEQWGHCGVPRRWPWNPGLGRWVHHQRQRRRRGSLSPDQLRILQAMGFEWSGRRAVEIERTAL